MTTKSKVLNLLFLSLFLISFAYAQIPTIKSIEIGNSQVDLNEGYQLTSDAVFDIQKFQLQDDLFLFLNQREKGKTKIKLVENKQLEDEGYTISISRYEIKLEASNNKGMAWASTTLLKLIENGKVPYLEISDKPSFPFRSLMVDLGRAYYPPSTLKQLIKLCQWYKIGYMHLHLTDDSIFAFSSKTFPKLATENASYSNKEIAELNEYAINRGVILLPEIDLPGHSTQLVKAMPELFGLKNLKENYYTVNMGKEAVYEAIDVVIGELCEAFPHSPYIHLGGDEVSTNGMKNDPDVMKYMASHNIENLEDLYQHFLIRITDMVKKRGKKAILWSGFLENKNYPIPNDVIVMAWETSYYRPQPLLDDGYKVINASWKPMYVVNNRRWSPKEIFQNWTPFRWETWMKLPKTNPIEVIPNEAVLGGSLCIWEQHERKALSSVRERIASVSEKLWAAGGSKNYELFEKQLIKSDKQLDRFLSPIMWSDSGRNYTSSDDQNYFDHLYFDQKATVTLKSANPNLEIRYTLNGESPTENSTLFEKPILIENSLKLAAQAFEKKQKIGEEFKREYLLFPISFEVEGLRAPMNYRAWDKNKFEKIVKITLSSKKEGSIKFTTDGSKPSARSLTYLSPDYLNKTTVFRAQLFDQKDQPIGEEFQEEFVKVKIEQSLTTGKNAWASNEKYDPGLANLVTDGEIAPWDHWSEKANGNNWIVVDLEKPTEVSKLKLYTFWDGERYYKYNFEVSSDNKNWAKVVDASNASVPASPEGYEHNIKKIKCRYIKLNIIYNSSNPGLHVVEIGAF